MARKQKIGLESSATRALLLDAAESLMREEGYAAVTTRRLGARAGIAAQLVHYYFPSMDDLFVHIFRRHADRGMRLAKEALQTTEPLRALWQQSSDPTDAALFIELAAVGNHRKVVRAEATKHAEELRSIQHAALKLYVEQNGLAPAIPIKAIIMLLASVGHLMVVESAAGLSFGHTETRALVERYVKEFAANITRERTSAKPCDM